MLKVFYGDMEGSIYNTSTYFDNMYEETWFASPLAQRIIKDVDDSDVLDAECIKSPVLGQIPPTKLSGGTKTLLLMMNEPETTFNASTCGDNCAKWILELSKKKDLTINLRHIMDFGDANFEIEILNNNMVVHNMKEMLPIASKFLG